MLEAAARRELRAAKITAKFVANIINLAGRQLKRAVTVDDILGLAPPRKKYKWRTAAEVMQQDQERARRAAESDAG